MRRFLSLGILLLLPATAFASAVILTDDTYISSRQADKNFNSGHDPSLVVDASSSAFLRFDFSNLSAGQIVSKATLIVFVNDLDTPGSFDVLRVQGPWTEETLTGRTAPPAAGDVYGIAVAAASKFVSVDVTGAVRDWMAGHPNYGLVVRPGSGSPLQMQLDSKESIGTSHEARIEIETCGSGATFYRDADGDGYGSASTATTACSAPAGYVTIAGDCDDGNSAVNPGAPEVCNGRDDNCNGTADEGVGSTFYRDADSDGYGSASNAVQACSAPAGYVPLAGDCNDTNPAINPGRPEVCNGTDDNCNGVIDEGGGATTFYRDADGDTWGTTSSTISACSPPPGFVARSGDCNDANPTIHPGASEVCNGVDDDCDGIPDDGAAASCPARPNTVSANCMGGTCTYTCAPGFANCNGSFLDGCEVNLNQNPACTTATFIGAFPGDSGGASVTRTGTGDAVFRVDVREDSSSGCQDTVAVFELSVPPGQDYDLSVRCESCGTAPTFSTSGPGVPERISVFNDESCTFGFGDAADQSFTAIVEVIFVSGDSCTPWSLRGDFNRPRSGVIRECN